MQSKQDHTSVSRRDFFTITTSALALVGFSFTGCDISLGLSRGLVDSSLELDLSKTYSLSDRTAIYANGTRKGVVDQMKLSLDLPQGRLEFIDSYVNTDTDIKEHHYAYSAKTVRFDRATDTIVPSKNKELTILLISNNPNLEYQEGMQVLYVKNPDGKVYFDARTHE